MYLLVCLISNQSASKKMWHDQAFSQRNKATKTAGGEGGRGVGRNLKMGAGGGLHKKYRWSS